MISVQAVVQKLTPFFAIIAPTAAAGSRSSQSGATKKRGAAESGESSGQSSESSSKKRKASELMQVEPSASPSASIAPPIPLAGEGSLPTQSIPPLSVLRQNSCALASQTVSTAEVREAPKEHGEAKRSDSGHPAALSAQSQHADPTLSAFKASLLKGFNGPEEPSQPTETQAVHPHNSDLLAQRNISIDSLGSQPRPVLGQLATIRSSSETQVSYQASHTSFTSGPSLSTDQVSLEVDLLPRSPLVDTSTPPPIPYDSYRSDQQRFTDFLGLDSGIDDAEVKGLNAVFRPMLTSKEEEAIKLQRDLDEAEWGDGTEVQVSQGLVSRILRPVAKLELCS